MIDTRSITLELLRHGASHNQLLSPLTHYLGLCGNHGAVDIHVPYDHAEFLQRIWGLKYAEGLSKDKNHQKRRQLELAIFSEKMTRILGSVPGLVSALSPQSEACGELTHLRLVINASELSMLPFELSKVPAGCPGGANNFLLLQTVAPVAMTRKVRAAFSETVYWPRKPRILFIFSDPGNTGISMQDHLNRLMLAIRPWLGAVRNTYGEVDRKKLQCESEKFLKVLKNPTMIGIKEACTRESFTHVHVLAHGAPINNMPGDPFGIVLASTEKPGELDVVSGSRFASLLRSPELQGCRTKQGDCMDSGLPAVVTLATCESAAQSGDVTVSTGSSFAYDLHVAGIPFVVASQFPLSVKGAPLIVEELYPDLLWGENPRLLSQRLRARLYALNPDTHDWASIVIYDGLPDDIDEQLLSVRYEQARDAVNAAMSRLDRVGEMGVSGGGDIRGMMKHELAAVDRAVERLKKDGLEKYSSRVYGLLGSTEKRKAEARFKLFRQLSYSDQDEESSAAGRQSLELSVESLRKALGHYRGMRRNNLSASGDGTRRENAVHWALVQELSLELVLGAPLDVQLWLAAEKIGLEDLRQSDVRTQIWAHSSLIELYLLLLGADQDNDLLNNYRVNVGPEQEAEEHLKKLLDLAYPEDLFPIFSLRRQLLRYLDWWLVEGFQEQVQKGSLPGWQSWEVRKQALQPLETLAGKLVERLPKVPLRVFDESQ